jgi:O-antigen/teichoic acid export membrane protein
VSIHINRFIDSVKAHESRGQRDFMMPMKDAKDLHRDITKMLLAAGMLSVCLTWWAYKWSVLGAAMAVAAAQGVLLCLSCGSLVRARQKPTPLS